ncbi:MAG TPA: asparagine synthase (glutamine-hydrolyzing) [Candidatus Sulfotelmatobacter sp.]|nr:asparagine synthase (glutamine-hydrolyzing) [Candidatus Sulfotelmatobacter sp.]
MCGIFGQIGSSPAGEKCGLELRHRGPDDGGMKYFALYEGATWVSLQHRRLSIIDLSSAGHQPMCNEDESVWITFNGEIYNFQELRAELVAAGHQFRSHTDTEVIVHGYEEWGNDVVRRLRGMFAFAIWDHRKRRMLLATDHLGKKPLFYSDNCPKMVFASEIKAILKAGVPAELDPVALHDYLTYLYFPYPSTAFKHVRKMGPGSAMEIVVAPNGELHRRMWKYWDAAETAGSIQRVAESQMIDQARELMEEAVKLRLVSDVPLGLFLSGGLDSSAITAFASKHSPEQVKTFTIGFANSKFYDELPVANMVAQKFRTEHHILQADEACADYMTKVVRHFDEPFGNPTAILEYIITKLMRKHVTVAISGDGGDELFGGYVRYAGAALARQYRKLPQFVTKGLVSRLSSLMHDATDGRHGFRRVREFAQSAWQAEEDMYINWVGYFSEQEKRELYSPAFAESVGGRDSGEFLRQFFRRGAHLEPLSRLGYVDSASFLCCNCLEYADRMSMANSLEVRAPFTDYRLLEFAMQVPQHMKVRRMTTKWITRQALKDILPREVLEKKKMGFNPPLPQWINGELKPVIRQFLSAKAVESRGIFRPEAVQTLLREHEENRRDNALKIWALLMIEVWQRMYFDGQSEDEVLEAALGETRRKPTVPVSTEAAKGSVVCIR